MHLEYVYHALIACLPEDWSRDNIRIGLYDKELSKLCDKPLNSLLYDKPRWDIKRSSSLFSRQDAADLDVT